MQRTKPSAAGPGDGTSQREQRRERHLDLWLGTTSEALALLLEAYDILLPRLLHDLEMQRGVQTLRHMTVQMQSTLAPHLSKYDVRKEYSRESSTTIRDALFPAAVRGGSNAYEALAALQGLLMYLAYIEAFLVALSPASAALWDQEFADAVTELLSATNRQQAWVRQQIKVKAPQTLVVPSTILREDLL